MIKNRCFGNKPGEEFYADYHDNEWGVPVYDEQKLFEMLILEGAQAGLSWVTILKKRNGYRRAFHQFDIHKVANMADDTLEALRHNTDIIRNKLKIYSARRNAQSVLKIQKDHGSFSHFLWSYVDHRPIITHWETSEQVPITTSISDQLSKDLKQYGMTFVGSIIIYAYMQAIGMVNDHLTDCWKRSPS